MLDLLLPFLSPIVYPSDVSLRACCLDCKQKPKQKAA